MARKTYEAMVAEVVAAVESAGGVIDHAALIEQLPMDTARQLSAIVKNKDVVRRLVAQSDGSPARLRYSLPQPAQPAQGGDA